LLNADGSLSRGSRVGGTQHVTTGQYLVGFDRSVTGCGLSATALYSGFSAAANPIGGPSISVTVSGGSADVPVWVTVTC